MQYVGGYKALTYLSWILSAVSAVIALLPFVCIWLIIRDVLAFEYGMISTYGTYAVCLAILAMLIYIAALMCSHVAAFRVAANMRKSMLSHVVTLPIGVDGRIGSGKLRKIINESSAATETYLAHQLPDRAAAVATPVALIVMLLWFDWRLGLLSLLPVALGFIIMMRMTGDRMQERMKQYQDALAQDVTLFDNTIMENIRIGRRNASDEEVIEAGKMAQCLPFVEKLADGWYTMIGENGCELSGGERQRISIARAFLKNSPVILLDEATASLDAENETAIQRALSSLIKDKTVLIIAHRMRTVENADKIVVLSGGHVAEEGRPDELMERRGIFSHMVALQKESSEWRI